VGKRGSGTLFFTLLDLVLRATHSSDSDSELLESISSSSSSSYSPTSSIGRLRGLPRGLFSVNFNSAARTIFNTSLVLNTNSPCNLILLPLVLFFLVSSISYTLSPLFEE